MAHWDDSGTAVGYEGKGGDKLILKSLSRKNTQKKKIKKKVVVKERVAILENEEEMDKLYQDFELDDNSEINDIVSGRIGEIAVEW